MFAPSWAKLRRGAIRETTGGPWFCAICALGHVRDAGLQGQVCPTCDGKAGLELLQQMVRCMFRTGGGEMRLVSRITVVALLLGLSGCASGQPSVQRPAGQALLSRCGADRLIGLIGAPVTALPSQPSGRSLRVLRPGDPVTEDFSETRLNVILDSADRITAVSCG